MRLVLAEISNPSLEDVDTQTWNEITRGSPVRVEIVTLDPMVAIGGLRKEA